MAADAKGLSSSERQATGPIGSTLSLTLPDDFIAQVAACIEQRPAKRLFTVPETAVYLGRSSNSVRELERSAKLIAVRIDGRVMFDRSDLDDLIEASKAS